MYYKIDIGDIMKLELREYNVTPKIEERNDFYISVSSDNIKYNKDVLLDKEIIEKIFSLLKKYKEKVLNLTNEVTHNYKGGRQQIITIQYDDGKMFHLIGNTPNKEIADFYLKLKEEILKIINK